jgi:hypothetical protein
VPILCVALLTAATVARARVAWPPGPEAGFTADVYLSAASALRGAAPQLEGLVREASHGRPVTFYVAADDTDPALAGELTDALGRSFGDAAFFGTAPDRRLAGGEVHVEVLVRRDPSRTTPLVGKTGSGAVVINVRGAAGDRACTARFTEKPWLTDFDRFAGGHVPGRFIVGQADDPAATPDEAAKDAVADAVAQIMPLLATHTGRGSDMAFGAERVAAGLSSGRYVVDRFACRFERPYGSVHHEAILVDVDPSNLVFLAQEAATVRRAVVQSRLGTAGSLAGLVATIGLIYLIANSITKGYFARVLQTAAFIAAIAGATAIYRLFA